MSISADGYVAGLARARSIPSVSAARPCTAGFSGPSKSIGQSAGDLRDAGRYGRNDHGARCSGGASCARQAIAAGIVDEIDLQVNPVILGSGERLLDGLEAGKPALELVGVLEAPGVAHVRYRVVR
jgi:RibD domain-containing protein